MKYFTLLSLGIVALALYGSCSKSKNDKSSPTQPSKDTSFLNPLLSSGPDPWVIEGGDNYYYYTATSGNKIILHKTQYMDKLGTSPAVTIWIPPSDASSSYNADIWAPELHYLDNKWYMYFAADNNGNNASHRIYVLENSTSDLMNPTNWVFKGKLSDDSDKWAIDATIFTYKNANYVVWSGWPGDVDGEQDIYIAQLSNPYTVSGSRVLISKPHYPWEGTINEGPEALFNVKGQLFLTYSGNGCWSDDYCLGLLTLKEDGNPLDPAAWTKSATPVFTKNTQGGSFGPGHNGFFKSPDGKEDWIIYHANNLSGQGCGDQRNPRIQKFTWKTDGTPDFGTPVGINMPVTRPSGE